MSFKTDGYPSGGSNRRDPWYIAGWWTGFSSSSLGGAFAYEAYGIMTDSVKDDRALSLIPRMHLLYRTSIPNHQTTPDPYDEALPAYFGLVFPSS